MKLKRNQKFWGIPAHPDLVTFMKQTTRIMNEISCELNRLILEEKIKKLSYPNRHLIQVSPEFAQEILKGKKERDEGEKRKLAENIITDTMLKDWMEPIFNKYKLVDKIENFKRSIVKYIVERYSSYENRNRKGKDKNKQRKKAPIRIHEKVLYFKDNSIKINTNNNSVTIRTLFGDFQTQYKARSINPKAKKYQRIQENQISVNTKNIELGMAARFHTAVGSKVIKIEGNTATFDKPIPNEKGSLFFKNSFNTYNKIQENQILVDKMNLKLGSTVEFYQNCQVINIEENKVTLDKPIIKEIGDVIFDLHGTFGGNLTYHPKTKSFCLVVLVNYETEHMYEPKGVLAFDMNKTPKYWLTFNDGKIIQMNKQIKNLSQRLKRINKILNLKNKPIKDRFYVGKNGNQIKTRTKQRKKIRIKQKKTHAKLKALCCNVAEEIIKMTVQKQYLLAIDSVKGGDKTGSYGQDHLIKELQRMCENKGIPFYVVPCQYTSMTCSVCNKRDKKNRKTVNEFKCTKCNHEEVSHLNAAKNIAKIAEKYLEIKKPYGNYS